MKARQTSSIISAFAAGLYLLAGVVMTLWFVSGPM